VRGWVEANERTVSAVPSMELSSATMMDAPGYKDERVSSMDWMFPPSL